MTMKKLFSLLSLCALFAISCDKPTDDNNGTNPNEPSAPTTTITLSRESISVGKGNGMGSVSYTIENPTEDLTVEATADVAWINSFSYKSDKIEFSIDANPLYEERTGTITVTYGEASDSVTIIQAAQVKQKEIEITAPYLIGEYYGDYACANYNYYIAFSSSDYDANIPKPLYAPGWKYFLDVYASGAPADYNNIRIPNGVYTLTTKGEIANSLFGNFSIYKEYDNSGFEINEKVYEEATLTVTDDMVKLEVVFEGSNDKYIVTYSGDYSIIDERNAAGGVN